MLTTCKENWIISRTVYNSVLGQNEDLEEKKLLGSGGYVLAKLTEQEELRVSLGVPQIFLANVERLNEDRFSRYFCNKCNREYIGCYAKYKGIML